MSQQPESQPQRPKPLPLPHNDSVKCSQCGRVKYRSVASGLYRHWHTEQVECGDVLEVDK